MKRMTPTARLLLDSLKGKYKHFSERNMLASDGSFYCLDKYLMQQLGIGDNTIRRARIFLKEIGEINYAIGKHKGASTWYWILTKGSKTAPFGQVKEANLACFSEDSKGANLSPKDSNLVSEDDKEGIRAYARLYGIPRARIFWVDKGYNLGSIREILEGV